MPMVIVGDLTYKYFGGHRTKALAQAQAKSLRKRGHLATIRHYPTDRFPWRVYWYDRSSRRQRGLVR